MSVCQGLKVEIGSQQLTVNYLNQSQSSAAGVTASRADFAEELGDMNRRYQAVASDVSERLKTLNSLQLQWSDCESQVDSLTQWFAEQDARLSSFVQVQDRAAVHQAVEECRVCILCKLTYDMHLLIMGTTHVLCLRCIDTVL